MGNANRCKRLMVSGKCRRKASVVTIDELLVIKRVIRYRVEVSRDGVSVFELFTDAQGDTSWRNHRTFYTYTEVPEWIQTGIAMLDLANADKELNTPTYIAGVGYAVPGINIYYLDYKGEE